jgi:hypothetical protein
MAPFINIETREIGVISIPVDTIASLAENEDGDTIVLSVTGKDLTTTEGIYNLTARINNLIMEVG